jgi:hypothetical protein
MSVRGRDTLASRAHVQGLTCATRGSTKCVVSAMPQRSGNALEPTGSPLRPVRP